MDGYTYYLGSPALGVFGAVTDITSRCLIGMDWFRVVLDMQKAISCTYQPAMAQRARDMSL